MNKFIDNYIHDIVKAFRLYNKSIFEVSVCGLKRFVDPKDLVLCYLLQKLNESNIIIIFESGDGCECFCTLKIKSEDKTKKETCELVYNVQDILCLIELSSKTGVSLVCFIIMKIVVMLIGRQKTLYKAIVLDLDETVWCGTLLEDGIEQVTQNLRNDIGVPFVRFMNYVKGLAENLGIYVAICSRNNSNMVLSAIENLEEEIFPIKHQIDCIIANDNDKSTNLKEIASTLSILTNSLVFIDDNQLVRDEVRLNLPEVCTPDWNTHDELMTRLTVSCLFDRFELSLNAQNKRKQYRILQTERMKNDLPSLLLKVIEDKFHNEVSKLYKKSNQFKFSQHISKYDHMAKSLYLEMFRETGESIGICSAITFLQKVDELIVSNWALSCRCFEIGLEESILLYIVEIAKGRRVLFEYQKTEHNGKVTSLIEKYNEFIKADQAKCIEFKYSDSTKKKLKANTNLTFL